MVPIPSECRESKVFIPFIPQRSERRGLCDLSAPTRDLGGTASPSGRCGVRSRSRPPDQTLRVLAASGEAVCLSTLCQARENPHLCFLVPGTKFMKWYRSDAV